MNTVQSDLVSITEKWSTYVFTVFPDTLNYAGTLFGGKLLAEMDLAVLHTVRRFLYGVDCDGIVTAHVSEVNFLNPAFLGDIIELKTKIIGTGRTSVTVKVVAESENLAGERQHICNATFVMVVLKDKKPMAHSKTMVKD